MRLPSTAVVKEAALGVTVASALGTIMAPVIGLMSVTFSSISQLVIVCLVGYYMARIGVLDKKMQGKMNKMNVSVFTPSLLFSKIAFSLSPERLVELAIVPVGFVVVELASAVASVIASRAGRIPRGQRNFVMACAYAQLRS